MLYTRKKKEKKDASDSPFPPPSFSCFLNALKTPLSVLGVARAESFCGADGIAVGWLVGWCGWDVGGWG